MVSELVKDSIENEDDETQTVDVIRVSTDCLSKVVDFLKHNDEEQMLEIPTPLNGNTFEEVR